MACRFGSALRFAPFSPFTSVAVFASVLLLAVGLLIAPAANADVVYSYAHPLDAALGACETDPILEVEVVYPTALPPNTPLPSNGSSQPPQSYSFSACGFTCVSGGACGIGGPGSLVTGFAFGTDGNGDIEAWTVTLQFLLAPGEDVNINTWRQPAGPSEGELVDGPDAQGASISVGSWTSSITGGPEVPVLAPWARLIPAAFLGASGLGMALRRSWQRRVASRGSA